MKSTRWRIVAGAAAVAAAIAVVAALLVLARVWTEYLWYQSIGQANVYVTRIASTVGVWAAGAIVAFAVFYVAASYSRRLLLNPPSKKATLAGVTFLAVLAPLTLAQKWMTFRLAIAQAPFGTTDPLFHRDLGFFVFSLPAFELAASWLNGLVVLAIILVLAVVFLPNRNGVSSGPANSWWHLKTGLSVLLGFLMLSVAFRFWITIWRLVLPGGGHAGAFYTDVHAGLPANWILVGLTVLLAIVLFASAKQRSWKIPALSFVSWVAAVIVIGTVWPALVQSYVVAPNEASLELPYLKSNISMTRDAYDLAKVTNDEYPAVERLTPASASKAASDLAEARLWTPSSVKQAYDQLQTIRPYYRLSAIDTDRYKVNGRLSQVLVSAREMDTSGLPKRARTWVNKYLVYTHGYGLAISSASGGTLRGFPQFLVGDVPPVVADEVSAGSPDLQTEEPRIYYGPDTTDYAILNTGIDEFDYPSGQKNAKYRYTGDGGAAIGSSLRRLAWAVRLGSSEVLFSNYVTPESRVLINRDITSRVQRIAPWLTYDQQAYPALVDGRIVWILDAYTSTDHYPYSQPTTGGINYVRDSVKVTVDAFTGETRFYAIGEDPIRDAWAKIFPTVLTPADKISPSLAEHFRYPRALFDAQAQVFKTYHMTDPNVFYNKEDQWQIVGEKSKQPVPSSYLMLDLPGSSGSRGMYLMQPYAPANRDNMIGWLAAKCDPKDYGAKTVWLLPKDRVVLGPAQVVARIEQDPVISPQLSLWDQRGSKVVFGQMLMLPVEQSIAYVQPIFLQAQNSAITQLASVVVIAGDKVEMGRTLSAALAKTYGTSATSSPSTSAPSDVDKLLAQVAEARKKGDFTTYSRLLQELQAALNALLGSGQQQ